MNRDPHEPALLPCEKPASQTQAEPKLSKSQLIRWRLRQLFGIVLIVGVLYVGYRFLIKILTPEVLTVIGINAGLLILRWIIRIVLRIAYTIFSLIFWIILTCILLLAAL